MDITVNVAIASWAVFWITYWIAGIALTWKAHVDKVRKITHLKEVCTVLCINMFWSFIAVLMICFLPLRALTDSHIIVKLTLNYLLADIWFYHIHIMLHSPDLYRNLHKMHHKFSLPYALTALYCSGYETIFLNSFAAGLGMVIFSVPPPYVYIWFFLVALNSTCSHSGYKFWVLIDGAHEIHHTHNNKNFGFSPWFDMLYGTHFSPSVQETKGFDVEETEVSLGNFPIDFKDLKID
jgi:sterol desaturase/sphingolipid hydroxylase (fatty acid hydroxylase superfamily)